MRIYIRQNDKRIKRHFNEYEKKSSYYIHPTAILLGKNKIGAGVYIGAFCVIENCEIDDGTKIDFCCTLKHSRIGKNCYIRHSMIEHTTICAMCKIFDSNLYDNVQIGAGNLIRNSEIYDKITIGENAAIGVFAHIHNNCTIGDFARIGNFVELKNTTIGNGTKCAHLAYLGDGKIGEDTNIGAGTIFCNYDGKNKFPTRVGARCFIGSNCTIIAPLSIGDDCFVGADSCVCKDLPSHTFFVRRSDNTKQKRCKDG